MTKRIKRSGPCRRLGWSGYADILRALQRKPMTSRQVSERFGIGILTTRILLGRMLDFRLVHRCAFVKQHAHASEVPVWAYGYQPCATSKTRTGGTKAGPLRAATVRPELIAFAAILKSLDGAPVTYAQVVATTGCTIQHIGYLIQHMRKIGMARIADWQPPATPGTPAAMYQLGCGADAKRPPVMTRSQIEARCRQRRAGLKRMQRMISLTAANLPDVMEAA